MTQQIESELWEEFKDELEKKIKFSDLKVVMPSNLDHKDFWDKFLNTKFPDGDINNTLEKNFAIYIIQNKLNIEQIKEKYKEQGWKVGGLLGWIKKVNAGDILLV